MTFKMTAIKTQRFLLLVFVLSVSCVYTYGTSEFTRKVNSTFLTPPKKEVPINFVHTQAVGPNDTLHYVFTTYKVPSVLMAKTLHNTTLTVNWEKFLSNETSEIEKSITFSKEPEYTSVLLLNRILEYNDTNDNADLTKANQNASNWVFIDFAKMTWENSSQISNLSDNTITFLIEGDQENLKFLKTNGSDAQGNITLQFHVSGKEERNSILPHLEFTPNTTQLDFTINQVATNFTAARFALEMTLITTDEPDATAKVDVKKSIDDEFTPGAFELVDWLANDNKSSMSAYLQWKPVCYTSLERTMEDGTEAKEYNATVPDMDRMKTQISLALGYFGNRLFDKGLAMTSTNVSFGLSKDKFYNSANYTSWSVTVGIGSVPVDGISLLIIIIIAVGLGLPILFIIMGGFCLCLRKRKQNRGYTDLTDEASINT